MSLATQISEDGRMEKARGFDGDKERVIVTPVPNSDVYLIEFINIDQTNGTQSPKRWVYAGYKEGNEYKYSGKPFRSSYNEGRLPFEVAADENNVFSVTPESFEKLWLGLVSNTPDLGAMSDYNRKKAKGKSLKANRKTGRASCRARG